MTASAPATLAALLRRLRHAAGLSQEELAERAGLSARGVSDLERGLRTSPRPETLRMLSDALGLGEAERADLIAATHPDLATPARPTVPVSPPAEAAPPPVGEPAPLPIPPTGLIGREVEVARLRDLLDRNGVRLVTLTGPGGVGKTRLALEVAAERRRAGPFAAAVAFVELAALRDSALVPPAIGRALRLRESADVPIARQVIETLAGRRLLLVLDNCEHLPVAPVVAELLAASPGLTILATSRERLRLRGERTFPVPPLSLPDPGAEPSASATAGAGAVRLFVERVAEGSPDFALTEANAAAVAAICQRLDGLPLALELAAAWTRVFPPAALLARLDRRLDLLVGGPVDLPARQQTLRAAISWSHDLLTPDQQAYFRRLALFAGGWTLEAAEAVGGEGAQGARGQEEENVLAPPALRLPPFPLAPSVVDGIAALVDKSLVRVGEGADDQPRYLMLETVREFALERLEAAGEVEPTGEVHARYFLALTEEASRRLFGPEQIETLRRLDAEDANLTAALEWLLGRDSLAALEMAGNLWGYWTQRGRQRIGRTWTERALPASEGRATVQRGRALLMLGNLAIDLADFPEARDRYEASLADWRVLGEPGGVASALMGLGLVAAHQGDHTTALARHEESLRFWQAAGDRSRVGACFQNLGNAHLALGDLARAAEFFDASLAVGEDLGDSERIAYAQWSLARVAARRHDRAEAERRFATSRGLFARVGDPLGEAGVLTELGRLAFDHRADDEGLRRYRAALRLLRMSGDRLTVVECIEGIAMLHARTSALDDAAVLFGAAACWRERLGAVADNEDRTRIDRAVADLRTALPAAVWAERFAAGADLALEQAAAVALGGQDRSAPGSDAVATERIEPCPSVRGG